MDIDDYLSSPDALRQTASAQGLLLSPGQELDGFRVRAFLGRGATSEVWRVHDPHQNRDYALKIFAPPPDAPAQARQRFLTEARALDEFRHPNLMRRHLLKDDGAHPYFTMDVLRPLPERVSKRQLPRLLEDVCAGLETLHAKGIVHRDVKPANILLANDGRAVLADLGVAHIADADLAKRLGDTRTPDPTLLNGGSFVGTPRYAAPEQLAGEAVTPATDVYALGVVIEELLDGKPPFPWNALVRRMTASRPLFRPQSIRQVRRGIRLVRAWPRILGLVAAAALGIAAVAIWQRARPDWIEVSSVPADVITLNGGRYIQARLRVQPIAIPPETNALTAANALEQQFQKMFATRYRRRPIRVQGAGTLKCPDVAGCEIHLAPGVTFITTGRFTPDGNLIKKPLPPADATREDPDAVGYPSFVVEKGARLVFTENDAYPRGLIRME